MTAGLPAVRPVYTIGHSTRSLDELAGLLASNRVELLADIRSTPASRRLPHFAAAALAAELRGRGIAYLHLPGLGGRRTPRPGSLNAGWRNPSFRAYADHMQEDAFRAELDRLLDLSERPTAIMCSEAVPWRCHRTLVADALTLRGRLVLHIIGGSPPRPHVMTPFARAAGERLWYPAPAVPPEARDQRRPPAAQ